MISLIVSKVGKINPWGFLFLMVDQRLNLTKQVNVNQGQQLNSDEKSMDKHYLLSI
jgi:hypothetical protein